ncbi:hypothetical protein N9937_02370, partial [bacterium]|nr:hypothetical protein [bacterium]
MISIDQSLGKCAWTLWEDGKPINSGIFKSGNSKVKNRIDTVTYFDTLEEQIHYLCDCIYKLVCQTGADKMVFEALSFASIGNATRDLAQLFGAIIERLISCAGICVEDIYKVAPTSLKSFARELLPEDERFDGKLSTGKPKKVKMDKKLMVK